MKKTGIVLIVLMFAGLFSFLSITPREKAKVEPVKITKKIPAPVSGKPSNEGIAEQNCKGLVADMKLGAVDGVAMALELLLPDEVNVCKLTDSTDPAEFFFFALLF